MQKYLAFRLRDDPPVQSWKLTGLNPQLSDDLAFTFFVDATTGKIVRGRNEFFTQR